uniref:Baculoviral IAP repeat containing 5b n=1 Tax=Cyprinus carpio TaxID=7962 RepID=A0A8C1PGV6_CYPCA
LNSHTQPGLWYGGCKKRLQMFSEWPFREDCQCTPELMAKAGFAHCPSENEPEVACCFYCLRELEGWEPEDNPWSEHAKCSPNCAFLCMKKTFDKLTAIEYFQLEQEWLRIFKEATFLKKNIKDRLKFCRKYKDLDSRRLVQSYFL